MDLESCTGHMRSEGVCMYTPNVHNPENCNLWIDDSTVPSKKNDMALLNRQYMNPLLQRVRGGV